MDMVINFIISVVAGIVSNYICKWLNRKKRSNQPNKRQLSIKSKTPRLADRGVSFACKWKSSTLFQIHYTTFLFYFLVYKKHPSLTTWVFFREPNINYFHTFFACPHYIIITKKLKPHGPPTVGFLLLVNGKSSISSPLYHRLIKI